MTVFDRIESNVRGYCRSFPVVFEKARGAELWDEQGRRYIDFLAGAGTLNYGHNNPRLKPRLLEYIAGDGLMHGLDLHSAAKRDFLETFERLILWPREQEYKVQFTGPTGANAVEAAIKLARRVTGRTNVVAFTNAFHGVTLGAVANTGNSYYRNAAGVPLGNTTFMPYDGFLGPDADTIDCLQRFLDDPGSGLDAPAAVIVETVQGEGGVNIASAGWLQRLEMLCRDKGVLLIVDDIQVGCGRTGTFFSFEDAGITPDIVTLSKSLGAYGLPLAVVLMRPELDQWKPGEHNGTFRGNNLAFVAAAEALRVYWSGAAFSREVRAKAKLIARRLEALTERYPGLTLRGRGMIQGLAFEYAPLAKVVAQRAFARGLVIETSGPHDQVLKFLPPLVIEEELLNEGLDIVEEAMAEAFAGAEAESKTQGATK